MQTFKTKTKRTMSRAPRVRKKPALRYIMEGSRATHVVLPIDVYDRMMLAEMARESQDITSNPGTKWTDVDDFFSQVAVRRIVAARKAKGITQQELANRLGLAQTQISRIESNPDRTSLKTLKRIAKALRVDVKNLID